MFTTREVTMIAKAAAIAAQGLRICVWLPPGVCAEVKPR